MSRFMRLFLLLSATAGAVWLVGSVLQPERRSESVSHREPEDFTEEEIRYLLQELDDHV